MAKDELAERLARVDETLATAHLGLQDFLHDRARRLSGFRNFVVFARSVTFTLQNLKNHVPGFDAWYAPHVERMKSDPAMKYFVELRNKVLKTGATNLEPGGMTINVTSADIASWPRPPGAHAAFLADHTGGAGWLVRGADGQDIPYYVDVPDETLKVTFRFADDDLPEELAGVSIDELATAHYRKLEALVQDARATFDPPPKRDWAGRIVVEDEAPTKARPSHLRRIK